jgi:hypothetical protein
MNSNVLMKMCFLNEKIKKKRFDKKKFHYLTLSLTEDTNSNVLMKMCFLNVKIKKGFDKKSSTI